MFNKSTELKVRDLELALELIPDKEIPQTEEKETTFQKVKSYFTGNSNIWYSYEFNEKTNNIEYSYPRTFSGDVKSVRNYFSNLFK